MNQKSRIFAFILALAILLSACGGSSMESTDSTSGTKDTIGQTGPQSTATQPTEPEPTDPEPTDPEPTDPEPTEPEPTEPEPTEPEPPEVDPLPQVGLPEVSVDTFDITGYSYSMVKVGSFSGDQYGYAYTGFLKKVVTVDDHNEYELLSSTGQSLLTRTYRDYTYFGNGICVGRYLGDEIPVSQLIDLNTGEIYIDQAAKVEKLTDRYYYVIYATERTDNRDECFIYFTDSWISLNPGETDVMYKGYAKIYDMKARDFVEGITLEQYGDVYIVGDTIACQVGWTTYDLYYSNGTCSEDVKNLYFGDNIIIQADYSVCHIYDSNGYHYYSFEKAQPIEDKYSVNGYSDEYLYYRDENGNYGVIDIYGNEVLAAQYSYIYRCFDDYFVVTDASGKYGIVHADGTQLVPFEYGTFTLFDDVPIFDSYVSEVCFVPGVGIVSTAGYRGYDLLRYQSQGNAYNFLIWKTLEIVQLERASQMAAGLVWCTDGFVDLIQGKVIMDTSYEYIESTGEYIYCYNDGIWDVYKVELNH